MWAVKVKDQNVYAGVCVIPQPGFTTCRFPGNDTYWPEKFPTEEMAQKAAKALRENPDAPVREEWEVVPYPEEKPK